MRLTANFINQTTTDIEWSEKEDTQKIPTPKHLAIRGGGYVGLSSLN